MSKKALSLRAAADELGVHHTTLCAWIEDGIGPRALIIEGPTRRTIRIQREDLDRFKKTNSRGGTHVR